MVGVITYFMCFPTLIALLTCLFRLFVLSCLSVCINASTSLHVVTFLSLVILNHRLKHTYVVV